MEKEFKIVTIVKREEEKILRAKISDFDFKKHTKKEIDELVKKMRLIMKEADGVGLAANQIGLNFKVFVAQLPKDEKQVDHKFYAIFNPQIVKFSEEKTILDEGCLSVPGGLYGGVERSEKITLEAQDKNGKKIKIKAWGLLARVFQHEVDHLNGKLFIDRTKNLKRIETTKERKI